MYISRLSVVYFINSSSAVRAIAAKAAKDAIESFVRSELSAHLGYEKGGRRASGASDARNGAYERTVQTSFGPITV